jgi:hypothetical protein
MFGHRVYPTLTRWSHGLHHPARESAIVLAGTTMAAGKALMGRSRYVDPARTRDELYAEARAIGIHGRGGMTKDELASAIRRARAPTPAFILVRAARRRATAMHTQTRATLDSLARLTRDRRLSLAPALAASWRSPHRATVSIVAVLAAVIGGAMPLLVYGMNPKSAERVMVEVRAHPLGKASARPSANSGTSGREQSASQRRAHRGKASPSAGSKVQEAAPLRQKSSSGSHVAGASAQSSDAAARPSAHESASDEEGAYSDDEASKQDEDSSRGEDSEQG